MSQIIRPRQYSNSNRQKDETPLTSREKSVIIATIIIVVSALLFALFFGLLSTLLELFFGVPLLGVMATVKTVANLPWALVTVNIFEPALIGAVTGLLIGWMRRGLAVRQRFSESLVSSLFSSRLWQGNPRHVLLQFVVQASCGFAVGLMFSSGGVFLSAEGLRNELYPMATMIAIAAGGPGGGGFDLLMIFLSLLVAAIIVAIIAILASDRMMAWLLFHLALKGSSGGGAKHLFSIIVDEWDASREWKDQKVLLRKAFRKGVIQGAVTGVITGSILLIFRGSIGV